MEHNRLFRTHQDEWLSFQGYGPERGDTDQHGMQSVEDWMRSLSYSSHPSAQWGLSIEQDLHCFDPYLYPIATNQPQNEVRRTLVDLSDNRTNDSAFSHDNQLLDASVTASSNTLSSPPEFSEQEWFNNVSIRQGHYFRHPMNIDGFGDDLERPRRASFAPLSSLDSAYGGRMGPSLRTDVGLGIDLSDFGATGMEHVSPRGVGHQSSSDSMFHPAQTRPAFTSRLAPRGKIGKKNYVVGPLGPCCPECARACSGKANLRQHLRAHSRSHQCPNCPKRFAYVKDLRRHERTKHSMDRPFKCHVRGCKYAVHGFKRKDNLKRHRESQHSENSKALPAEDQTLTDVDAGMEWFDK